MNRNKPKLSDARERAWLGAPLTLLALLATTQAHGSDDPPEALDVTLLRAGAIVAATFASVEPAQDGDPAFVEAELHDLEVVSNRFADMPGRIRLRAKLQRRGADSSAISKDVGELAAGRRYIFFFSAEDKDQGPFASGPESAYAIADNGWVRCGSGYVTGIDPHGVVCGAATPDMAPMSEQEFLGRLRREHGRARLRRPKLHAAFKGSVPKFRFGPK